MSNNVNKKPAYPFPIRVWNSSGIMMKKLGIQKKIEAGNLMDAAEKQTGLSDYGDEYFVKPLERLVESINEEADLHALGRYISRKRLINLLANRLRVEEYYKLHPELNDMTLLPIWWIVGLQRTGTTLLQRLLAGMEGTASISSWEALNPVPFKNDVDDKRRVKIGKTSEKGLRYIAPEFFAIHPVEHLSPEEEVLLLDISFLSTVPEATLNVPSYAGWVQHQEQRPAYEYMRKILKLMQSRKTGAKRWVLKSPHHMEYLEELHEVFPEAWLIFTHRDPIKTIASFCSMVYYSKRIFSSSISKETIASHWKEKISLMLKKSLEFREKSRVKTIDVAYHDLVTKPTDVTKGIFEHFGDDWDGKNKAKVRKILKENKKNKYGAHKYSLEDFGLDRLELQNEFKVYRDKYSEYINNGGL